MKAGALRRKVTIQSRTSGADAAGGPLTTWTDVATVFADIKGGTGLSTIRNDVSADVNAYSVRIRYRSGLNAGMRIVFNGQPFDVTHVRMDFARREWVDLVCEVGGNDG